MVAATMHRPGRSQATFREKLVLRVDVTTRGLRNGGQAWPFPRPGSCFQFVQQDDGLIVRGCVPSFYLKQVLQTALMKVEGVHWLDNQVNVVCCDGLSSV